MERVLLVSGASGSARAGAPGVRWLWVGLCAGGEERWGHSMGQVDMPDIDDTAWSAMSGALETLCGMPLPDAATRARKRIDAAIRRAESGEKGPTGMGSLLARVRHALPRRVEGTDHAGFKVLCQEALAMLEQSIREGGPPAGVLDEVYSRASRADRIALFPVSEAADSIAGMPLNDYPVDAMPVFNDPGHATSHVFEREALACGLSTHRLSLEVVVATDAAGQAIGFDRTSSHLTTLGSAVLASDKQATRRVLQSAGLPTPEGRSFEALAWDEATTYAHGIGYPVVLKPGSGARGEGVVAGIADEDGLGRAFRALARTRYAKDRFIVEKHVAGNDYRIFATATQVLSVVLRQPASVGGDGRSSILELVLRKNALRLRNPHLRRKPIVLDEAAIALLHRQGLGPASVPGAGQHVRLCSVANLSRGGDSIEVIHETHPSILDLARRAIAAVPGLPAGGVDLLVGDHRKPLSGQVAGICEINSGASLSLHESPVAGPRRSLAPLVLADSAKALGLTLSQPRRERLELCCVIEGDVDKPDYLGWLVERGRSLGLDGRVRVIGARALEVRLAGPTSAAASLVTEAISGGQSTAWPESVRTCTRGFDLGPGFDVHA